MPVLHILRGDKEIKTFECKDDLIEIGRKADNHLVLDDDDISRRHVQLKKVDGGYVIVDLGSANGVLVNGKKVAKQELAHNDTITLGGFTLIYKTEAGQSAHPDARTRVRPLSGLTGAAETTSGAGQATARPAGTAILRNPFGGKLIMDSGPKRGEEFAVFHGATIGRNKTCDVVLEDPHISGNHARI